MSSTKGGYKKLGTTCKEIEELEVKCDRFCNLSNLQ